MAYFSHSFVGDVINKIQFIEEMQRVLTFTWIDVASCSMFLVMARFARWVHESIANVWPGMVQDSSVQSFVQAYATPADLPCTCSDHSSASATHTLCAGPYAPYGPDGPNGLVPTENRAIGTSSTLATGHTDDGATCGDGFTRQSAASDICFGCSSRTSGLRHPRDYTDCTVCRPVLGKPKKGLEKNLDQMRTGELLLFKSARNWPDHL